MIHRTRDPFSTSLIDGFIALSIATASMGGLGSFSHALRHLGTFTLRAEDCVAALVFLLAWQYCFHLLKVDEESATAPSRIWAALKGVLLLIIPVFLYFRKVRHDHSTIGSVLGTFLALYLYEILRLLVSSYLLDRLAARDPRRAIIIGSGRRANKAWRFIRTRYYSSVHLLGFMDDRRLDEMPPELARLYLGTLDQLGDVLLSDVVDMILIAMPIQSCYPLMQRAVDIAESAGVQVMYLDDIYLRRSQKKDLNQSIFRDLAPEQDRYLLFLAAKRIFDVVAATTIGILLLPLMLLIGLGVRLTSRGSIFLQQECYGHRRRRFKMIKFRSMVEDALPTLDHAKADGLAFKSKEDPRVTGFGKFLHSTSLDELPQLWNVIRGGHVLRRASANEHR